MLVLLIFNTFIDLTNRIIFNLHIILMCVLCTYNIFSIRIVHDTFFRIVFVFKQYISTCIMCCNNKCNVVLPLYITINNSDNNINNSVLFKHKLLNE